MNFMYAYFKTESLNEKLCLCDWHITSAQIIIILFFLNENGVCVIAIGNECERIFFFLLLSIQNNVERTLKIHVFHQWFQMNEPEKWKKKLIYNKSECALSRSIHLRYILMQFRIKLDCVFIFLRARMQLDAQSVKQIGWNNDGIQNVIFVWSKNSFFHIRYLFLIEKHVLFLSLLQAISRQRLN